MRIHFTWLLLSTMWLGQAGAADRFEDIRELIRGHLITGATPSMAVAAAQDGKILWEEGFGWADRERRVAASEHTIYSLASISKPLTATGLMVLAQLGKIDLDRPANDYLGYAKLRARVGDAQGATVRRVANHTAGLPLHFQFFFADEPFQRPAMDETLMRYANLITAPGERFQYSNLGYGVLDYIIERVSGVSYEQFMRQNVFLPLGMTHTSVGLTPALAEYAATRYGEDGLPVSFYDFDHRGGSAIFASAHDLVRFGMFHLKAHLRDQQAILRDATIDEMHRSSASSGKIGYGIGFMTATNGKYSVVSHAGGMVGVTTQMLLVPDRKLAIVVLSNSSSMAAFAVADRIAEKLLPGWQASTRSALEPPAKVPFATPAELAGVWKGSLSTYAKEVPMELRFLRNGDVHVKLADQLTTLVNGASFTDGIFMGEFNARIGTPDTERRGDYKISLSITLRGESMLDGGATAITPNLHSGLTHWVELRKEKISQE